MESLLIDLNIDFILVLDSASTFAMVDQCWANFGNSWHLQNLRTYIMVNTSSLPLPQPKAPTDTEHWRAKPDHVEAMMMKIDCQTWEPRMVLTPFFAHEVREQKKCLLW